MFLETRAGSKKSKHSLSGHQNLYYSTLLVRVFDIVLFWGSLAKNVENYLSKLSNSTRYF